MAEQICDSKSFTIGLDTVAPNLTIIDYTPPANKKKGEEVQVNVTIKNIGGDCKYKIKLIDVEGSDQGLCGHSQPGETIDENPNTYIGEGEPPNQLVGDTIKTGETKTREVNTNGWCGAMPDKNWKLRVEAWRKV